MIESSTFSPGLKAGIPTNQHHTRTMLARLRETHQGKDNYYT
jgi:hypothetical protein